eukprot:CAMPEP_0198254206 /NCGR_PEP_ID=MMETSP1447-20131203/4554_1 /TAXON_ID=420782 /ORGANISM="Chaetoceros dichaeta, Strain CCMP1751" /LENGTH=203 /DNA_ID=CAMNT_0043940173 /DNA_START=310 /DNA_END=921 /DNA_ORIENTATION=-
MTLTLTDKIYLNVINNNILASEQKGTMRKAQGCKDRLLLLPADAFSSTSYRSAEEYSKAIPYLPSYSVSPSSPLRTYSKGKIPNTPSNRKSLKSTLHGRPCVTGIPLLTNEDNYKYIGILQTDIILHDKVKEKSKDEYFKRVRGITRAGINVKYSMKCNQDIRNAYTPIWLRNTQVDSSGITSDRHKNEENTYQARLPLPEFQ